MFAHQELFIVYLCQPQYRLFALFSFDVLYIASWWSVLLCNATLLFLQPPYRLPMNLWKRNMNVTQTMWKKKESANERTRVRGNQLNEMWWLNAVTSNCNSKVFFAIRIEFNFENSLFFIFQLFIWTTQNLTPVTALLIPSTEATIESAYCMLTHMWAPLSNPEWISGKSGEESTN